MDFGEDRKFLNEIGFDGSSKVEQERHVSSGIVFLLVPWAQSYKTLYIRNLQFLTISWAFVFGKPLRLSLVFTAKAAAYPKEE